MLFEELKQVVLWMGQCSSTSKVFRSSDNVICLVCNKDRELFFDMTRSESTIYMRENFKRNRFYQAPFDVMLSRRIGRSLVESIELLNSDKVIRIKLKSATAYKKEITLLQFEFTGRYTNAIIMNESEEVLEALRHVDLDRSSRCVKIGQRLDPVPKALFKHKSVAKIDSIENFLLQNYEKKFVQKVEHKRGQYSQKVSKKVTQLKKRTDSLQSEEVWLEREVEAQQSANIIMANLHKISIYKKELELENFDGKVVKIDVFSSAKSAAHLGEIYFNLAKKARQKAEGVHIEHQNLEARVEFLEALKYNIEDARSEEELDLLVPAVKKRARKEEKLPYEVFRVGGYRVLLGKSERSNAALLKAARAGDIWLHLKDRASAHVVIVTDKKQVPQIVLEQAAKLCVDFSLFEKGRYLVDYTHRRNVRVLKGANVLYNPYETLVVQKE